MNTISTTRYFKAEYAKQKPLAKKEIYRLKPGSWVELRWRDAPNQVVILLEKVEQARGDCAVQFLDPVTWVKSSHATHDQIVAHHGQAVLVAPRI